MSNPNDPYIAITTTSDHSIKRAASNGPSNTMTTNNEPYIAMATSIEPSVAMEASNESSIAATTSIEPSVAMEATNESSISATTTEEPSTSSDETANNVTQRKTVHDFNEFISTFTSDEGTPFTNGYAMLTWKTLGRKNDITAKTLLAIVKEKGLTSSKSGLVYRLKLLQRTVFMSHKNLTIEWPRITSMMNEMFTLPKRRTKAGTDESADTTAEMDDFTDDDELTDEFLNSFFRSKKYRKYANRSSMLALHRDFDSSAVDVCDSDSTTVDYKFPGASKGSVSASGRPTSLVSDRCSYLDEYSDNAASDEFFYSFFRRNDATDPSALDLKCGVGSPGLGNRAGGASAAADTTAEVPVGSSPKLDESTDSAQEVDTSSTEFSLSVGAKDSPIYSRLDSPACSRVDSTIDYKTDEPATMKNCKTEDPTSDDSPGSTCRIF